jgi:hypothetical protein
VEVFPDNRIKANSLYPSRSTAAYATVKTPPTSEWVRMEGGMEMVPLDLLTQIAPLALIPICQVPVGLDMDLLYF